MLNRQTARLDHSGVSLCSLRRFGDDTTGRQGSLSGFFDVPMDIASNIGQQLLPRCVQFV